MKYIKIFLTWLGIYCILMFAWQYFETLELGYTLTTVTDSVVCMFIAGFITWLMWVLSED